MFLLFSTFICPGPSVRHSSVSTADVKRAHPYTYMHIYIHGHMDRSDCRAFFSHGVGLCVAGLRVRDRYGDRGRG